MTSTDEEAYWEYGVFVDYRETHGYMHQLSSTRNESVLEALMGMAASKPAPIVIMRRRVTLSEWKPLPESLEDDHV